MLGLGEAATLKETKIVYRRLAHRHHPDKHDSATEENEEMMKKLNWAYKVLMDYCTGYSFLSEAVARKYPNEEDWKKWRESWRM